MFEVAVADSGAGSKSVEMARNDFEWLVKNILFRYRDTQIDVRSSSEYRQLMEDMRVEESAAASTMLTDTSHVINNFDPQLYKRVQDRNNNTKCCTFIPTPSFTT